MILLCDSCGGQFDISDFIITEFPLMDSTAVSLADLDRSKVVVYISTICSSCRVSFPEATVGIQDVRCYDEVIF